MKKAFTITGTALIAGLALMLSAPLAMAHDQAQVSWSISVGTPFPAPVIYSPPPVVYVRPQPVYVEPVQVIEYHRPQYIAYDQPYYVEQAKFKKHKHKHWKHFDDDD